MITNIFNEWQTSKLGLGTYNLSPDKGTTKEEAQNILLKASELGINILDTAPLYGGGYVECLIGDTIKHSNMKIINKLGRFESLAYKKNWEDAYNNEFMIKSQFDFSLRLLNRECVDMLLIHEADWNIWWKKGFTTSAILNVLEKLKKEGLVKKIGISLRNPYKAKELCESGLFDSVLFVHYYNILWQDSKNIFFDSAKKNNMGITIGTPFKQGLLVNRNENFMRVLTAKPPKDLTPNLLKRLKKIHEISEKYNTEMPELSLRYLVSDSDVDVIFAGPRNLKELEINHSIVSKGPLSNQILEEIYDLQKIPLEENYNYEKV